MRLFDHLGRQRVLLELDVEALDRPGRALFGRVEGARTKEPDSPRRSPADVDDDRVSEGGLLADEPAVRSLEIGQLPLAFESAS